MYSYTILTLLLVTLTLAGIPEDEYCAARYRRLCRGKGRHIGCQFPDPGPGASCERYTKITFTNDLKHFILHFLNRRRQRIAIGSERVRGGLHLPKPQIMMLVEWDRELAQLAQRLADQCFFVHDDCRATVKYPYAGQTVGEVRVRRSSESDELSALRAIRRVLDAWWGEKRRVQPKQLTSPFRLYAKGTVWGHFSQLAVWNLQAVGCGAVRHGTRHPRLLLVCDFSHTNMLGQRTLVPGPMAPCPIHTARRPRSAYPALCEPVRHIIDNQEEMDLNDNNYEDDDTEYVDEMPNAPITGLEKKLNRINSEAGFTAVRDYHEVNRDTDHQEHRGYADMSRFTMPQLKKKLQRVKPKSEEDDMGSEERREIIFRNKETFSPLPKTRFETQNRNTDKSLEQWRKQDSSDIENEDIAYQPADIRSTLPARLKMTYRPIIVSEETVDTNTPSSHRRWKQTRFRPQRPGANAILHTATAKMESKKPVVGSLNLDTDDTDQLFRDTGFNLHARKQSTLQRRL